MRAHVGDRLVVGTDTVGTERTGTVIGVPAEDGSPPYIVRWKDGYIAMVQPDQYARIIPAGGPGNAGAMPVCPA